MLAGLGRAAAQPSPQVVVEQERREFAAWLASSPLSPYAAIALQPIGPGITLGPRLTVVPLDGVAETRVVEKSGAVFLETRTGSRPVPRGRFVPLGPYRVMAAGPAGRAALVVHGPTPRDPKPPAWYRYDPAWSYSVSLSPPAEPATRRLLASDGQEVVGTEAGTVSLDVRGERVTLVVRRLPDATGEESALEIYFRDATNGAGTYPAGRFVALEPVGGGRYRLDFNRARNAFCAYSTVFACPAPWRGNVILSAIAAGEQYRGGGLAVPADPEPPLLWLAAATQRPTRQAVAWRAALDLAGGPLRFEMFLEQRGPTWTGRLCNGPRCETFSAITPRGDSLVFELADYDAAITALARGDSLAGYYRNVGNRGPRIIPFRAARGAWTVAPAPERMLGSWDATFMNDGRTSPRVLQFRNGVRGVEMNFLANSGDYGLFWGGTAGDSVDVAHFDGAFVYRLTARLDGDTLRGTYHAGLRTQTPFTAVRTTGRRHLTPPAEVTRADTVNPFRFAFPDLEGRVVTNADPRFRGKVVLVDIFGSWCPTCHDAAPTLGALYREYRDRGLMVVGLAYEVTGDTVIDNRQVRRFRDKFAIEYPLLLAGLNVVEATAATLPQLQGFTAYPTTLFLGRDGRIRRVHAGFIGPAVPGQHEATVREFRRSIEELLAEP